jgi:hypothetical protein
MGKLWIFEVIIIGIIVMGSFILGWAGNNLWDVYKTNQEVAGLYFNGYTQSEAEDYAYNRDSTGQWVCINVNSGLEYKDIVETCSHEAGHELFARKCANNPEVCQKMWGVLNDTE